ncbi:MAG: hypothetical protein LBE49_05965 [Deltaproteobacteria bacterium]|jgi:hypothetical protein|nr:hypothetical protein [Deltaproteobacteria bacterium]
MRAFGRSSPWPLVLALAAFLLLSGPAKAQSLAETQEAEPGWTERESGPGSVKFKISGPASWEASVSSSSQPPAVAFLAESSSPFLRRALGATGQVTGPSKGPVGDLAKMPEKELEAFAAMAMEGITAGREPASRKLLSFGPVKIDGQNALELLFETSFNTPRGKIFEIIETFIILYNQKGPEPRSQAAINLACSYAAMEGDQKRVESSFEGEGRELCRKFADSLKILDK